MISQQGTLLPTTVIESVYDCSLPIIEPRSDERQPGLHVSTIYTALAQDLYPRWFKVYEDQPERYEGEVNHFTKGLVLERAWGDALAQMLPQCFVVPESRLIEDAYTPPGGCWTSADGLTPGGPTEGHTAPVEWPSDWPSFDPATRSIHECKVSLKSSREATSPITHEKFITWLWQVKAYCYAYRCTVAYIHVLHLMGDYQQRPNSPKACVHKFVFQQDDIDSHWAWLMDEAKKRGLK